MLKKLFSLVLVVMIVMSLVSCKKAIFETAYYKDDNNLYVDIPEESKVIASYEAVRSLPCFLSETRFELVLMSVCGSKAPSETASDETVSGETEIER